MVYEFNNEEIWLWLEKQGGIPDESGMIEAAINGHINILEYLKYKIVIPPYMLDSMFSNITINGHLNVLKWFELERMMNVKGYIYKPNLALSYGHTHIQRWLETRGVSATRYIYIHMIEMRLQFWLD
jgi:hypothetical protein